MNVDAILKELRTERDALMEAILSLERLAASQGKRRGRPPAWMAAAEAVTAVNTVRRRGRAPGKRASKS